MSPLEIEGKLITFEQVAAREVERAEGLYNAGLELVAQDVQMAIDGGDCHRCGKPWQKIAVDRSATNTAGVKKHFATFVYYRPECGCYPKCRRVIRKQTKPGIYGTVDVGCGRIMYEELDAGIRTEDGKSYLICNNCEAKIYIDGFLKRRDA